MIDDDGDWEEGLNPFDFRALLLRAAVTEGRVTIGS